LFTTKRLLGALTVFVTGSRIFERVFQSSADTEARIRRAEEKIHRLEKLMQMTGLSW
jgi:hypothetical protein